MRARAEAMIRIESIITELTDEDRSMIAFDIFRTYGNTKKTPPETLFSHVNGGALGGSFSRSRPRSSPKNQNLELQAKAIEVLAFLNEKTGKTYRPVEENLRFIRARLANATVEDCKGVVARKTREWLHTEQSKYLRPATLFNAEKFEQYIGEQKNG